MNATYNQSNNSRCHYDLEIVFFSNGIEFCDIAGKVQMLRENRQTNKKTNKANQNKTKNKKQQKNKNKNP